MNKKIKTKLRVGDLVQRICGRGAAGLKRRGDDAKDRQPRGKIVSINFTTGRAVVQGLNTVYRHKKRTDPNNPDSGGRIEKDAPIHLSNLMLVDPQKEQITRVGSKEVKFTVNNQEKTRRARIAKLSGAESLGGKK
jgi:large subunit ribosomal protein L24